MSLRLIFSNISTHGVRVFAVRSDLTKVEKLVWGGAIMMGIILICTSLVSLSALLSLYLSTLAVEIRTEKMVFPAVTACNSGKYKKSVVSTVPTFANMAAALSIINTKSTINERKKRDLHVRSGSTNENTAAMSFMQRSWDTSILPQETSHILVKRQSSGMCQSCTYLNGMCVVYAYDADKVYVDANTSCHNGADGVLPTFKSQTEIATFQALKDFLSTVTPVTYNSYNYLGYTRGDTNSNNWTDDSGLSLPAGSTFTNVFGDYSNHSCLLLGSYSQLHTYPCWAYNQILTITDYVLCNCPLLCPTITIPTDTIALNISYGINSIVNFACPPGYYMNGSSSIICNSSAYGNIIWSSAPPTCTQSVCPPLNLTNQIANATNSNLANIVGFSCPTGLDLIGQSIISCIPNGSQAVWSSDPPICSVDAPFQNYTTQQFLYALKFIDRVDTVAAADQLNNLMEFLLSYLNVTQMAKLGFQRGEFIRSCLFNKMTCKYDNTELVEVPELLNCYTFNHKDQQTFQISSNLGQEFGLTTTFDTHLDEYINTILTPGVQLFIQEQFDPILYGAMGIVLSPGLMYHISIAKFVEQRLSVPTRHCVTDSSSTSNYIFSNSTFLAEGCLRSYIQYKLVAKCGCGSPKYPLLTNQHSQICNITGAPCVISFLQSNGHQLVGEAQQICPTPCRSVSFKLFTTFTKLTINQIMLNSLNVTATYYRKNIVTMKLYQQTDMTIIYSEALQYDVSNILASIGGSIGCIAGMSLVSIVEIFALIAAAIFQRCH